MIKLLRGVAKPDEPPEWKPSLRGWSGGGRGGLLRSLKVVQGEGRVEGAGRRLVESLGWGVT
jgi:hypothetical protein